MFAETMEAILILAFAERLGIVEALLKRGSDWRGPI
jgi:hypothetical protein